MPRRVRGMNGRSSSRTPRLILAVRPCRFRVGGRVIFSNEDFLMTVPFHPHADIFPMMTPQEQMGLADDIRAHGLRNKIVVHEGAILDGRNRYQACLMAGVDPAFDEFDDSGADALNFVMSLNMHRRHLTDGERATAAAKLANIRFGDHQHTFGVCKFADPRHLSILGRQEVRCIDFASLRARPRFSRKARPSLSRQWNGARSKYPPPPTDRRHRERRARSERQTPRRCAL